jgi:hypothetical protein
LGCYLHSFKPKHFLDSVDNIYKGVEPSYPFM